MASSIALIFLLVPCVILVLGDKCAYYSKRWYKDMKWCRHTGTKLHIGDFNGDRRADMFCFDSNSGHSTLLAQVGGTFSAKGSLSWCNHKTGQLHVGDFNGDGKQDLLCHDTGNGYKWIKFADQYGQFKRISWQKAMGWCSHKGSKLFIGDFNGDSRSDMLCHDKQGKKWIALADRKGHFGSTNWHKSMGWCTHGGSELHIGDFNGDCRSDMLCHDTRGRKWIALARPAPHLGFSGTSWHKSSFLWCQGHLQLFIGDFNGDKRADLLCHNGKNGYKWLAYNHGPSKYFTATSWQKSMGWCYHSGAKLFVGDFNGDNRDDILCHDKNGKTWIIYNECK